MLNLATIPGLGDGGSKAVRHWLNKPCAAFEIGRAGTNSTRATELTGCKDGDGPKSAGSVAQKQETINIR
jgi:hypothetical protein